MALTQLYSAVGGDTITAARWNNEFGNIYNNGTDIPFPATKSVSFAGNTITIDAAGVTTLTSPANTGFLFTVGTKSGAPSASGSVGSFTASTFTDTSTAAAGTATLWTGLSLRTPTLEASAVNVTTTEAVTLYIEGPVTAGANQTLTESYAVMTGSGGGIKSKGDVLIAVEDSRTNIVDVPLTVRSTTSGIPDVGIGTGILLQAESQDEVPSNVGQIDFTFSDRTTGSEDSYFQVLLRVAGAALSAAYRFVATSAFRAIFTHANTADRTYTFPDRNVQIESATVYVGPTSTGASSTDAHEGTVTYSASQGLSGTRYYTDVTVDATRTLTVANNTGHLCLIATGTITINGTLDAIGAGAVGGAASKSTGLGGSSGLSQPGGGGGGSSTGIGASGGNGGGVIGIVAVSSGGGPAVSGTAGTQIASPYYGLHAFMGGGGSGGSGGGSTGDISGAGGRGGGSITLIAPTIVLGASSAIKTSGTAGGNGTAAGPGSEASGGGGGGGAGNLFIQCQSYTDNGCTFTLGGGAGGSGTNGGSGPSGNGGAGAAGVRQINIYP